MSDIPQEAADLREQLRQAIEDGILTHTGRSVGDRASDEVAGEVLQLVERYVAKWGYITRVRRLEAGLEGANPEPKEGADE